MKLVCGWLAILLVLGCGGGGDGVVSGGTTIAPAELKAFDNAMANAFYANGAKPRQQQIDAYLAVMRSSSICERPGYSAKTDTVYCTMKDGMPYAFIDNRIGDLVPPGHSPIRPLNKDELPTSKKARLYNCLGTAFTDVSPQFRGWLNSAKYQAVQGSPTLQDFGQQCKELGYLYVSAHAGEVEVIGGLTAMGITTAEDDTPANRALAFNASAIAKKHVGRAGVTFDLIENPVDTNGNGTIDRNERMTLRTVFCVLPSFVKEYMSMKMGSFVMIDACTSLEPTLTKEFGAAGTDTYVGWDNVSADDGSVPTRFTDLVLGQNDAFSSFDPNYRPFIIDQVNAYLDAAGKNFSKGAYKGVFAKMSAVRLAGKDSFGLLRPAIKHVQVTEALTTDQKDELVITGIFGPYDPNVPRRVTLAGDDLTISNDGLGRDNRITCDLKRNNAPLAGELIVYIDGRPSLPLMLTEWIIPMTYTFDGPGSCTFEVNYNLRLRADMHLYREDIMEVFYGQEHLLGARWDSSATFTSSGTDGNQTWSGSGSFKSAQETTNPSAYCLAFGMLDSVNSKIRNITALVTGGLITIRFKSGAVTTMSPALATPTPFNFTFDANTFVLKGDTIPGLATALGNGTLTWPNVSPHFPPTSNHAHRPGKGF